MNKYLLTILLFDGLIWLRSSYGKLTTGNFPLELDKTLTKFASNNPYPWFKDFLLNQAIPQASNLGALIMYGEAITAVLVIVGSLGLFYNFRNKLFKILLLLGLVGAFKLNLMFWLASGWTSPSSDSLNLLMLFIELVGIIFCIKILKKNV